MQLGRSSQALKVGRLSRGIEVSFSGIEGSMRFPSEAIVTEPSGAIVGLSDTSHGSNTNQLGAAPNAGIVCTVGASDGAERTSRKVIQCCAHTFLLICGSSCHVGEIGVLHNLFGLHIFLVLFLNCDLPRFSVLHLPMSLNRIATSLST